MIVGEEEIVIKELYYVLMKCGLGNARTCKNMIKKQGVFVDDILINDPLYQVCSSQKIKYLSQEIKWPFVYYMMNKPSGYICANKDLKWPCVIDLIDDKDCYCVGRLDKDTTGLLIITNDSSLSKALLLPEYHVDKTYLVCVDHCLDISLINMFNEGVIINQKDKCKSAKLEIIDDLHCYVTVCEGKYHQVKKMFLSCGYHVETLKRISFSEIKLDDSLQEGEYRSLNKSEFQILEKNISHVKKRYNK